MKTLNTHMVGVIVALLQGCAAVSVNPSASAVMQATQMLPAACPSEIIAQARLNCTRSGIDASQAARSNTMKNVAIGAGVGALGGAAGGAGIGALSGGGGYGQNCYSTYYGGVRCYGGYRYGRSNAGLGAGIGAGVGALVGAGVGLYNSANTQTSFDNSYLDCFANYALQCKQAIEERAAAAEKQQHFAQEVEKPPPKKKGNKHGRKTTTTTVTVTEE